MAGERRRRRGFLRKNGDAPVDVDRGGACLGVGLFYIVAFVIGVIGMSNLTIISMAGRGDLENLNHIVWHSDPEPRSPHLDP